MELIFSLTLSFYLFNSKRRELKPFPVGVKMKEKS